MTSSLRLYHTLFVRLKQEFGEMRITQVRMMTLMIVGILGGRSTSLSRIALHLPVSRGKVLSLVNRMHRFLMNERIEPQKVLSRVGGRMLRMSMLPRVCLVMDATKIGVRGNLGSRAVTVSLCYRKRTLPLFSQVVPAPRGQIGWRVQKRLLLAVAAMIPAGTQVVLVADAGFEAAALVEWLQAAHWDFVLRRNGKNCVRLQHHHAALAEHPLENYVRLDALAIQMGETLSPGWVLLTQKHALDHCFLVLKWQPGEASPWFLIASFENAARILHCYRRRMWVEEMYGDLKNHGFDVERTHLTHAERIERLLMLAFLAYLICFALATQVVKKGLRSMVDVKSRRDKSYFRIGYDWLTLRMTRDEPLILPVTPYLK